MLGSLRNPPLTSGLNHAGSEMLQPPETKGRLDGRAPQDTLSNTRAAANAVIGTSLPVPTIVSQLKLVSDIAHMKDNPKPAGDLSTGFVGTDIPIPQKQLKFVEDISQQIVTQKLVGSTAYGSIGTDPLIPVKVPRQQVVKDVTLQMVTGKLASIATTPSNGTAVPSSRQVPWVKLVKDVTPHMVPLRPGSATVKVDYRTAVTIPQKMSQLKLVKDATPHTTTQKLATTTEKAIQQKKRKASNGTSESPVVRHKQNISDMPPSLLKRSSENSIPCRFSKAVLVDNVRSLAKLHVADELPGMLLTSTKNDMHLSRFELMENLRFLAKNNNFSNVDMIDGN